VSGDDVAVLHAPADSFTSRLVAMLGRLPEEGLHTFCVIGGLAVLCRVGAVYRATSDIDTVVDDDGHVVAALRDRPEAVRSPNGVVIDGTAIDVIEVGEIPHGADLPDDPGDRLFVLSHRYAYDSRHPTKVAVVDVTTDDELASAEVDMATPAALVAMKLQSYPQRKGAVIAKQGSDALDLHALLHHHDHDNEIADALAAAPHGLGELCADRAEALLIDDADVAAARVRRYTSTVIDADELQRLAERLVNRLRSR
jgi:hypothetical protein